MINIVLNYLIKPLFIIGPIYFGYKVYFNGFENILVSNIVVEHFAGGSIGPPTFQNQWEKFFHMSFSRCYIEKKYFGKIKSLKISISIILKSFIKLLSHILIFQFKKTLKDMASFSGALLYMFKIK